MSYTVVGSSGPKPRPGSVSVATVLLYVTATLLIVYGALGIIGYFVIDVPAVTGENVPPEVAAMSGPIGIVVSSTLYVVLAAGLVVLGVFVGKGSNPARIVTWVVGGIMVLCCACSSLGDVLTPALLSSVGDSSSQRALDEINAIAAATPGWLAASTIGVGALILLATVIVIIALMLPASNDYFRKEQEVWVPPTWPGDPSGGYPPPPPPPA